MKKHTAALTLTFLLSTGSLSAQFVCTNGYCDPAQHVKTKEIKTTPLPKHDHDDGTHSHEHIAEEELKQLIHSKPKEPEQELINLSYYFRLRNILDNIKMKNAPKNRQDTLEDTQIDLHHDL